MIADGGASSVLRVIRWSPRPLCTGRSIRFRSESVCGSKGAPSNLAVSPDEALASLGTSQVNAGSLDRRELRYATPVLLVAQVLQEAIHSR